METLNPINSVLQSWRFVSSPSLTGTENMLYDADLLQSVERGITPPTIRFFRFQEPTLTYGRLQKLTDVMPLIPIGWPAVQRPTGGGIVFHDGDLCISLCWRKTDGPLPGRPQEQYRWIHSVILEALSKEMALRMAACCDTATAQEPFSKRSCFKNPVGYDLLQNDQKILGGALRCTRQATLYQGSLQMPISSPLEAKLQAAFAARLDTGA